MPFLGKLSHHFSSQLAAVVIADKREKLCTIVMCVRGGDMMSDKHKMSYASECSLFLCSSNRDLLPHGAD